jgi:hypothetical protein
MKPLERTTTNYHEQRPILVRAVEEEIFNRGEPTEPSRRGGKNTRMRIKKPPRPLSVAADSA